VPSKPCPGVRQPFKGPKEAAVGRELSSEVFKGMKRIKMLLMLGFATIALASAIDSTTSVLNAQMATIPRDRGIVQNSDGTISPAPGFVWVHPDDSDDETVRLQPGLMISTKNWGLRPACFRLLKRGNLFYRVRSQAKLLHLNCLGNERHGCRYSPLSLEARRNQE